MVELLCVGAPECLDVHVQVHTRQVCAVPCPHMATRSCCTHAHAQVRELLQMDAAREAASAVGLPTSAAHDLMATGRLSTMSTTARSLRDTAPRGALRSPPSSRPSPTPLGGLGLSAGAGAGAERMATNASFAVAAAPTLAATVAAAAAAGGSSGVHVPGPETVRLGSLPPDANTLSRLECAR